MRFAVEREQVAVMHRQMINRSEMRITMKERLDVLVVERRLADSREKAKAIIMAGNVFVNGQREDKAGSMFDVTSQIEIHGVTRRA